MLVSSSLKVWQNSADNPSGPGLFFFALGFFFVAASISLHVTNLLRWLISSGSVLDGHMYLEICPFLLDFPIYLNICSQSSL
jgi:hypothetical protein